MVFASIILFVTFLSLHSDGGKGDQPGLSSSPGTDVVDISESSTPVAFATDREPRQNVHAPGQSRAERRERLDRALRGEVIFVAMPGVCSGQCRNLPQYMTHVILRTNEYLTFTFGLTPIRQETASYSFQLRSGLSRRERCLAGYQFQRYSNMCFVSLVPALPCFS